MTTNWGMLQLVPNLTSLRIEDTDRQSKWLLAHPEHAVCRAVIRLKGLRELIVEPDRSYASPHSVEMAHQLESAWKGAMARPNRL